MTRRVGLFFRAAMAGALAVSATAAEGCIIVTSDDSASIAGSWTIDGRAPTSASCAALGADSVRLSLYEVGASYPYDTFTASCAAGSVDSRSTSDYIGPGSYTYAFEVLSGGTVIGAGGEGLVTLIAGDHASVSANFTGSTFNPAGTDATVEAGWTIEGVAPSAASCSALGISRVRVAIQNGSTWYELASLASACSTGGFDTTPTPVLAIGEWNLQIQALDASDAIVGQGEVVHASITASGSHVTVPSVNFSAGAFNPMGSDATVSAAWTLNGRAPTSDRCYAAGIDRVRLVLFAATDVAFENGVTVYEQGCSAAAFDSRPMAVLRAGTYLWALEAVDSSNAIVADYSETATVTITAGSHASFPTIDYALPTTLAVGLDWTSPAGAATTCAAAGVQTFSYTLSRSDGVIIATADRQACQELLAFDSMFTSGFGSGTYSLYFEGFDSLGTKRWSVLPGTCTGVAVANGELVYEECVASYTP